MATVIFLACLSTIIALSALSAEYIREEFNLSDKLSYKNALIIILIFSGLISIIGLSDILLYSQPLINIAHPLAVALALVHIIDQKERVPYVQPIFLGLLIASIFSQMS